MNVYKLINPSDPWTFEAPNHKIAWLAATFLGGGKSPAQHGNWQSPMFFGSEDPGKAYSDEFGEPFEGAIKRHAREVMEALRTFMLKREEAPKGMDRRKLAKWNDKHRSSLSDYGKRANALADQIEKSLKKEGATVTEKTEQPEEVLEWKEAGIKDEHMLKILFTHHGIESAKQTKLREDLKSMSHASCKRTMKATGEVRDALIVRSKGSSSRHTLMVGKDNFLYCSCPAFLYKGGMNEVKPCKHLMYVIVNKLWRSEDYLPYVVK